MHFDGFDHHAKRDASGESPKRSNEALRLKRGLAPRHGVAGLRKKAFGFQAMATGYNVASWATKLQVGLLGCASQVVACELC